MLCNEQNSLKIVTKFKKTIINFEGMNIYLTVACPPSTLGPLCVL